MAVLSAERLWASAAGLVFTSTCLSVPVIVRVCVCVLCVRMLSLFIPIFSSLTVGV